MSEQKEIKLVYRYESRSYGHAVVLPDGCEIVSHESVNAADDLEAGEWLERAVACVNACEGIETEALDHIKIKESWGLLIIENLQLKKYRDELLESLNNLCDLAGNRPGHLHDYKAAIQSARDIIAKATGQ